MKREEITETRVIGQKWVGYGYFSGLKTEGEVYKWIDEEQSTLTALEHERQGRNPNGFRVTVIIEKLEK